jgi:hypothetical protein
MNKPEIDLDVLVAAVRRSLVKADLEMRKERKEALFNLETMELELKFTVTSTDNLKGGINLQIVSLEQVDDLKREAVQTVKLRYAISQLASEGKVLGARAHSTASGRPIPDVGRLKK